MTVKATVMELLPSASFKVKLENEEIVVAHAASAVAQRFAARAADAVDVGETDLGPLLCR